MVAAACDKNGEVVTNKVVMRDIAVNNERSFQFVRCLQIFAAAQGWELKGEARDGPSEASKQGRSTLSVWQEHRSRPGISTHSTQLSIRLTHSTHSTSVPKQSLKRARHMPMRPCVRREA